jgi:hypothetical protein
MAPGRTTRDRRTKQVPETSRNTGVDFADAATVLYDDRAITIRDDESGEERYVTIGMDALARILVVVYGWRGDRPRLISARSATPQERDQYEANS